MSCVTDQKLKINVFALPNVKLTIDLACNVGDIIRCNKAFLQIFRGEVQGVMSQNSKWTICIPKLAHDIKKH